MKRIQKRFEELAERAKNIDESKTTGSRKKATGIARGEKIYTNYTTYLIDAAQATQWYSSVENLLVQVLGKDSTHHKNFSQELSGNSHDIFDHRHAIFLAAKDDYENGYIYDVRSLVSAKVFSDELEQAEELLKKKHTTAAAVIAGTVLETTIRELAQQHGVDLGGVNKMNSDLAKEGVYNDAMKDQVQAWYKIRNNAAHGKPDELTESQVEVMIQGIRNFVAEQMK